MEPRRQVNRQWLRQIHSSAAPGYAPTGQECWHAPRRVTTVSSDSCFCAATKLAERADTFQMLNSADKTQTVIAAMMLNMLF